jgi:hypothetical protein
MTELLVGEKVKVRYTDGLKYTLDVEVTAICPPNAFNGRIERIFAAGPDLQIGEITGGDILALKGEERTFKKEDIISE